MLSIPRSICALLALSLVACTADTPTVANGDVGAGDTTLAMDAGPNDTEDADATSVVLVDSGGPVVDAQQPVPDTPQGPELPAPTDTAETDTADATPDAGPVEPGAFAPHALLANPFVGTSATVANVGSAYPGAAAPLGLVKVSPDTLTGASAPAAFHCAGYQYLDDVIYGFSHNHLHGTGAPDYGNIALLPVTEMTDAMTGRKERRTPYSHDDEVAWPGYYAVTLTETHVRAELTATERCAHHRYTFLDGPKDGTVLIDVAAALVSGRSTGGEVTIDPETGAVHGWNHNWGNFSGRYGGFDVFFTARFDRAPVSFGTWTDGKIADDSATAASTADPTSLGAYLRFDTDTNPVVEVQVCLSYVDADGANKALAEEMPERDFDGTRIATLLAWEEELSLIEVEGGSDEARANFYTSMYHVLQMPTNWTDTDGRYRGFDGANHQADGWTYYTDLSLWDTFRTEHPLLTLVWPEVQRDVQRSLAAMTKEGGYVPKWPMGAGDTGSMIGEHAASVTADSFLKGIQDFDTETLYAGLYATASGPLPPGSYGGRADIEAYLEHGYVPAVGNHEDKSVSLTLEYAFNDYCMAELATALGKPDDAAVFAERAKGYEHNWDPETAFFRPRFLDGTFLEDFEPTWWSFSDAGYVEGTAWQWRWFVPHDEPGLRALFGSDEAFVEQLSEFFTNAEAGFNIGIPTPYYYQGNEPDMHAPFLFIEAGRPELTQKWSRWILETNYMNTPDGLVGNDDAGTIGAWYVFAAVGLFPKPCFPGYYVTAPLFDRATLHLPGGDVVVEADGASAGLTRITAATWNGAPLEGFWITHEELVKGGTLVLTMGEQ